MWEVFKAATSDSSVLQTRLQSFRSARFEVKPAITKFNKASEKILLWSPVAAFQVHSLQNGKCLSVFYLFVTSFEKGVVDL